MKNTIKHESHYNRKGAIECWDEMILIFGRKAVELFCAMNAWKYRYRAGDKDGESREKDVGKSDNYMQKLKEMKEEDEADEFDDEERIVGFRLRDEEDEEEEDED